MSTLPTLWAAVACGVQDPGGAVPDVRPAPAGEPPGEYVSVVEAMALYRDPVALACLVGYVLLVLVLLFAPVLGAKGRKRGAALLGILGLWPLAMLVLQGSLMRTLDATNTFFRGTNDSEVFVYITGTAHAPGWQWPVAALVALWVPALLLWMRARRPPAAPLPAVYALVLAVWFIGLRVAVQLVAGPAELDFATRVNHFTVLLLPFVGYYAGRRGAGFLGFVLQMLIANLLVRGVLVAWAYYATTQGVGTWVDMGVVTDFMPPKQLGLEEVRLHDASLVEKWTQGMLFPQMVLWVGLGTVAGLVLGLIPWLMGRRNPDV